MHPVTQGLTPLIDQTADSFNAETVSSRESEKVKLSQAVKTYGGIDPRILDLRT
jgi:hypothetical protein